MITDLGEMTVGVAVPAVPSLAEAVTVSVEIAAPDVSAQITALDAFAPLESLSLADQVTIAQAIIANLEAAIAAGLTPPSLSAQAAEAAAISAELSTKLTSLETQLGIASAYAPFLAEAGVRVLIFDGDQDDFGGELAAELGADTNHANAIVLLTQSSDAWEALQEVLAT